MGRIIGIDFGEKRTGLAWTDADGKIAFPLEGVATADVMTRLGQICANEPVSGFVLGHPKRLDGRDTHSTDGARRLAGLIAHAFPDKFVALVDERFSSTIAQNALFAGGASRAKRRDKHLLDSVSAAVILQGYLMQSQ